MVINSYLVASSFLASIKSSYNLLYSLFYYLYLEMTPNAFFGLLSYLAD